MSPLTEPTKLTLAKGQPVPVDLFRSNVSLMLHGDGANGSTTITDSSPTPKLLAQRTASNVRINTSQSYFGGSSIEFINSSSLNIPASPDMVLRSSWTIEGFFWINSITNGFYTLFSSLTINAIGCVHIFAEDNTNIIIRLGGTGADVRFNRPSYNTWSHIALVSTERTIAAYVNGVRQINTLVDRQLTAPIVRIGNLGDSEGYGFRGYMDEVRITNGFARYSGSSFTVPTAPFLDF